MIVVLDGYQNIPYNLNKSVHGVIVMARPQKDPKIRINEILDAVEPLFYAKGYHETSIADIVTSMGVAHGTIYYYFKSKEEILEALIDRQLLIFLSEVKMILRTDHISPLQKIQVIIQSLLKNLYRNDGLLFEFLYNERTIHFLDKLSRQGRELTKPLFLEIIEAGIQKKYFQISRPQAAVNLIQAIIDSLIKAIYAKMQEDLLADQFTLAEELIEHVLGVEQGAINIHQMKSIAVQ
ncbi:hypothetical protein P22_2763 [Propionispora sp. 2/2-37]|uniref:TetR/AcrR family transcriptional regulator n=1 Tax=Propionispora sp. 2/2-37 TaxID=1677858 RepID=UPI0006C6FE12|nr:TetR/AcrR family transcriptional regulator [Propionispora sp. 2/2-37]CUH96673.1 hypothetical protein P22_2763 [Propionispora sp. 2/2-37]